MMDRGPSTLDGRTLLQEQERQGGQGRKTNSHRSGEGTKMNDCDDILGVVRMKWRLDSEPESEKG